MKEVLEFVFSSFWVYLGTFMLLALITRWRLFYINLQAGQDTKKKPKSIADSSFWKDLSNINKDKDKPDSSE